jgi:predicted metal-dependent hydrolase
VEGSVPAQLIEIEGIPVELIRKPVRNLTIRISREGQVRVSMPLVVSRGRVLRFVRERLPWIHRKLDELSAAPAMPPFPAGDETELRRQLEQAVWKLVRRYEPLMGVQVGNIRVKRMKSRWGSCSPASGNISINLDLIRFTGDELEYLVVHEMVHLLEPGHGTRFKELMDRYFSGWRRVQKELRGYRPGEPMSS